MEDFNIRTYGVKELALLYFPNNLPASAVSQLKKWIKKNADLLNALVQAGYTSCQKIFTPLQVAILIRYLGEPG